MRFLCDTMLGTLARWLRILGHDTVFAGGGGDDALLAQAQEEGRVLLTRDRELASRAQGHGLYVPAHYLEAQLRQVVEVFNLPLDDALSRCSLCNVPLQAASPDEVRKDLPPGVAARHSAFWRCPSCRRLYWPGSHYDRMVERIGRLKGVRQQDAD